jgi:hypothetical protein
MRGEDEEMIERDHRNKELKQRQEQANLELCARCISVQKKLQNKKRPMWHSNPLPKIEHRSAPATDEPECTRTARLRPS